MQLQRNLHEANLLTPTGKPAEIDLPLPQPTRSTVEHSSGRLIVHAPESLLVNPAKAEGLRPVSFQEAMEGFVYAFPAGPSGLRPVLAFMFTQEPVALRLAAERRKPQVTIRQLLVARIEEGVIEYRATFFYAVRFSGVKSLRIDVPADVTPRSMLRTPRPAFTKRSSTPRPPASTRTWSLGVSRAKANFKDEGRIELTWKKKLDKLDVTIPRLVPRVDRDDLARGQIALAKAETLDFQMADDIKGLRPIDPQRELMTPVPGATRAFEFQDEWTLPITITRYELEEVKRTSIDRAVCRLVLTPAGETAVQAVYRVRTVRPALAVQLPEKAAQDSDPVRINGQAAPWRKGDKEGAIVVPLANASAEEPFVLEIRYTIPGGLFLPAFPEDTAVQKVYLCAFVPPTQDVVRTAGSWSEDFQWQWGSQDRLLPVNSDPGETHESLVEWVCQDNNDALGAAKTFHVNGTPLIFSTLRPGAQTNVRLWRVEHETFNAWLFGAVLLAGVVLVLTSLPHRVLAVAALVVVLVLLGVFWPTLAVHVLGGPLFSAAAIVLLLWAVVGLFRLRWLGAAFGATWSAWVAGRQAMAPAAAPPATEKPQTPPAATEGGPSHD